MSPISTLSEMNTPLAMVVIGGFLARARLWQALKDYRIYVVGAIKLIVFPLLSLLLIYALPMPLSHTAAVTLVILTAAPVAANTVLVASMQKANEELAGQLVAMTTLLSGVTMPILVGLAQTVL